MIKYAVEAYRKDLNEYEIFEICAYIFSVLFIRFSRKPGVEALSMMIVFVLAIWEYNGSKIFKDKKKNGDELMKRKKLFVESGFDNRVRVLQKNLILVADSGAQQDDFFSQEKRAAVSLSGQSRHLEEKLNEWVCLLSPILPHFDQLMVQAYTTQVKVSDHQGISIAESANSPKKRKFWNGIWLSLSSLLIGGGIFFVCFLLSR